MDRRWPELGVSEEGDTLVKQQMSNKMKKSGSTPKENGGTNGVNGRWTSIEDNYTGPFDRCHARAEGMMY